MLFRSYSDMRLEMRPPPSPPPLAYLDMQLDMRLPALTAFSISCFMLKSRVSPGLSHRASFT